MFTTFRKCSCHYLTPRDNNIWTDDEDDTGKELKDKGLFTRQAHMYFSFSNNLSPVLENGFSISVFSKQFCGKKLTR